jgi:hypothetical protein
MAAAATEPADVPTTTSNCRGSRPVCSAQVASAATSQL